MSLGLVFLRHFDTAGSGRNPGEKYKYKYVTSAGTLDQTLATSWKSSMRIFERVPWRYEGDYVPPELKFQINTDKFAPGTYKYELISLDLIKLKLDLMSRYPDVQPNQGTESADPYYKSVEENLNLNDVYNEKVLYKLREGDPDKNWDPFTAPDPRVIKDISFTSTSGFVNVKYPPLNRDDMYYQRPDNSEYIKLLDFVLCIKKN